MEGVDVAPVESDGKNITRRGDGLLRPYHTDEHEPAAGGILAAC